MIKIEYADPSSGKIKVSKDGTEIFSSESPEEIIHFCMGISANHPKMPFNFDFRIFTYSGAYDSGKEESRKF